MYKIQAVFVGDLFFLVPRLFLISRSDIIDHTVGSCFLHILAFFFCFFLLLYTAFSGRTFLFYFLLSPFHDESFFSFTSSIYGISLHVAGCFLFVVDDFGSDEGLCARRARTGVQDVCTELRELVDEFGVEELE